MTFPDSIDAVRVVMSEGSSIPALRATLFLLAAISALAWRHRRVSLSLALMSLAAFTALGYWTVQIRSPLGLGSDSSLTQQWAQAGVNAVLGSSDSGYVIGMPPQASGVAALAGLGLPLSVIPALPALGTLVFAFLMASIPWALVANRASAALSSAIALGGGLWPGLSPYGAMLLAPTHTVALYALAPIVALAWRFVITPKGFRRQTTRNAAILIFSATALQAFSGGAEANPGAAVLAAAATALVLSRGRVLLRRLVARPQTRRTMEATLMLTGFVGTGLFWWDPVSSVSGFLESRDVGTALRQPLAWLQANVPAQGVVLASPAYSAPIAALGGRRVLFPASIGADDAPKPPEAGRRARLLESALAGRPLAHLAEVFSVTHLFLGPGEAAPQTPVTAAADDPSRLQLVLVYEDVKDFRVFRLAKK